MLHDAEAATKEDDENDLDLEFDVEPGQEVASDTEGGAAADEDLEEAYITFKHGNLGGGLRRRIGRGA